MLTKLHNYQSASDEIKKLIASLDLLLTSRTVTEDMVEMFFEKISEISNAAARDGAGIPSPDGLVSLRLVGVDHVKGKWISAIKYLRQYSAEYGCVGSLKLAGLAEAKIFMDRVRDRNMANGFDIVLPFRVQEENAAKMMQELAECGLITNMTHEMPF